MADLFGSTDTPRWLSPAQFSLESERAGAAIGQLFAQSFNQAIRLKEEQRQFDAMIPIRMQAEKAKADRNIIDALAEVTKQEAENRRLLGYTALSQVVSSVGKFQGEWNNPEFKRVFWETVRRFPSVTENTQAFKSITDNFDKAEVAKYNAEAATTKREHDVSMENLRQEHKMALVDERLNNQLELLEKRAPTMLDKAKLIAFNGGVQAIKQDQTIESAAKKQRLIEGLAHRFGMESLLFVEPESKQESTTAKTAAEKAGELAASSQKPAEDEAKMAYEWIEKGKDPSAVRALYKKKTGKDLP